MMKMMLSAVLMYTHVLLPLRWKQHEAYVQVLEAKYADLCCKCTHYNAGTRLHLIIIEIYLLMPLFFFIPFLLSFFLRRLSQWRDRAEGVGGEAQAAAAGVGTQGEHPGHATCHQGAGDARVHSMCLLLHFIKAFDVICVETWMHSFLN